MPRVKGKLTDTKQHLNFVCSKYSTLFTNLQDSKNFQIFSEIIYFLGFLINRTEINRPLPLTNLACAAPAVPLLWAALRDVPNEFHSYTALKTLSYTSTQ